jgi:hypothetical protein
MIIVVRCRFWYQVPMGQPVRYVGGKLSLDVQRVTELQPLFVF